MTSILPSSFTSGQLSHSPEKIQPMVKTISKTSIILSRLTSPARSEQPEGWKLLFTSPAVPFASLANQLETSEFSAIGLFNSSVGPKPSGSGGHGGSLSYVTVSIRIPSESNKRINSPPPLRPKPKSPM